MSYLKFKKKNIFYTDEGKGKTLVLLHGFTESSKIWGELASRLSEDFRVVCIDLPGHGKSDTVAGVHSMELMAQVVLSVLKKLRIGRCIMVGHSMEVTRPLPLRNSIPRS
jgi:pimeloyl-ACP methyl ester carboxylesterase